MEISVSFLTVSTAHGTHRSMMTLLNHSLHVSWVKMRSLKIRMFLNSSLVITNPVPDFLELRKFKKSGPR